MMRKKIRLTVVWGIEMNTILYTTMIKAYSKTKNLNKMFTNCSNLVTVPEFSVPELSKSSGLSNMFSGCFSLSNQSLDNILKMCISATSYTGTKALTILGFSSNLYSASTIQALPSYEDFIDAGWTIGY